MSKYDKAHFIKKFTAIPDELWHIGRLHSEEDPKKRCALGHCETREERTALFNLMTDYVVTSERGGTSRGPAVINDGRHADYQQPNPKARILAALTNLPD